MSCLGGDSSVPHHNTRRFRENIRVPRYHPLQRRPSALLPSFFSPVLSTSILPTYLPRYLSTSAICARGRGFLGPKISVKLHQPTFQVRFFFPLTYLLSGILVTHPLPGCLLLPTLLDPNIPRACNCTASQIQSRGHTPLLLSQRAALLAVPSLRLCNEHPLTSCLLTDHHLTLRLPSQ